MCFKLRKGVKFTDGTPFDANAVKWSIDRVMKLKGDPSWLVTDFVKRCEVLGSHEVKFNLNNPVAYSPSLVATVPYYPVNPNVYPADKIVTNPANSRAANWWAWAPIRSISLSATRKSCWTPIPISGAESPRTTGS
jgi:ABC-type transport system substrate-binding protein